MLTTKLSELATRSAGTLIKLASIDMAIPSRQQDDSKSVYYQRQSAKDVTINWETMNADTIIALIHACNPWNKGAVTSLNNGIIRLLNAGLVSLSSPHQHLPGTIISIDDYGVTVATINNEAVYITVIYNEEGFLPANRLKQFLIVPGNMFTNI